MSNLNINIEGVGKTTLTDRDYIAAGGEAAVYKSGKMAVKIYHDPSKCIPEGKIKELSVIPNKNVLVPRRLVQDKKGRLVGYAMDFVDGTSPLCKLFTKSFKMDNGLGPDLISQLVKQIQLTITDIHRMHFVMVDGNEMNYLVDQAFQLPYFIDTDSWKTPSFPATAIMDSIRDRQVKNGKFNTGSDWFAFACVAFQLYVGIHPYKGKHPHYKPKDWLQRMDDNVSVFDPNVKLPPSVLDFSVIPPSHLDWFKEVFNNGLRVPPPLPDASTPIGVMGHVIKIIQSSGVFKTQLVFTFPERIRRYVNGGKFDYFVGIDNVYKVKGSEFEQITSLEFTGLKKYKRSFITFTTSGQTVIAKWDGKTLTFSSEREKIVSVPNVKAVFQNDRRVFFVSNGRLYRSELIDSRSGVMHSAKPISNVLENSGIAFDGFVYQNILGHSWLTIPGDNVFFRAVPELDGYRLIDGKYEKNICVIVAEKDSKYYRFIFVFDKGMVSYNVRSEEIVDYKGISFTVLENGVCIMASDDTVHVFRDHRKVNIIDNSPFDESMKLFNKGMGACFMDDKNVYSVKMS